MSCGFENQREVVKTWFWGSMILIPVQPGPPISMLVQSTRFTMGKTARLHHGRHVAD